MLGTDGPRRGFERASLGAISIQHGPHAQALQDVAAGDVFGQLLDGLASFDALHVGLAQDPLVKMDIPRRGHSDFLESFRHQIFSTTGAGGHSSDLTLRHPKTNTSLPLAVVLDRGQEKYVGASCVRRILSK
jgi:hypothetical protein